VTADDYFQQQLLIRVSKGFENRVEKLQQLKNGLLLTSFLTKSSCRNSIFTVLTFIGEEENQHPVDIKCLFCDNQTAMMWKR
jgi:hypothetical protein